MDNNISAHITYAEATKSQTAVRLGIDNTPTSEHLQAMKYAANHVFEPVRNFVGAPVAVSCFYRSKALNDATPGASATSQHCKGESMDIDADVFGNSTNKKIFDFIKNNLEFDQLIWEHGNDDNPDWVHVSIVNGRNRKQVLRAKRDANGKTYYAPY